MNDGTVLDERGFFAAHAAVAPAPVLRERRYPRHRARRRQWKPPAPEQRSASELQAIQPQHAYDRDAFVR